jgi:N-acetylglucosaminyldiphosphoundecaprenol N-acetyl-beta-D-mannosaminyltransferase
VRTADVIGTRVCTAPLADVVDELEGRLVTRERTYVCFANAHLTATARRDERTAAALEGASFVLADGAPVAWAAGTERVAGADVFDAICGRSHGDRHFFLGSTPEVLALLAASVAKRYPGVTVCGTYSPPFGPELFDDIRAISERINAARPDVLWVGLGAPRQEQWMQAARPLLDAPLVLGVGAVFEFVAGTKRRAPRWLQRAGLEWSFRLVREPRRLARRYLVTNAAFSLALARQRVGGTHGR